PVHAGQALVAAEEIDEVRHPQRDVVFAVGVLGHGAPQQLSIVRARSVSEGCPSLTLRARTTPNYHSIASSRSSGDCTRSSARWSSTPCTSLTRSGLFCGWKERQRWIRSHSTAGASALTSCTGLSRPWNILASIAMPSVEVI